MTNICAKCGLNIDMVGRSHRCVPKTISPESIVATRSAASARRIATSEAVVAEKLGGASYKHRDADKWRAYMRDYMRARRAKSA
jgi:hypothetical protein